MPPNSVDLKVVNGASDPLSGVLVRIFDSSNVLQAQGTTSAGPVPPEGHFLTTLNGAVSPGVLYTVRFSRENTAFDNAAQIAIIDGGLNQFLVTGQDFSVPFATDPQKCRIYGFLVDVTGTPLRNSRIEIINKYLPQIVTLAGIDHGVFGERVAFHTDNNGFVQFDLIRNSTVEVFIPSHSPVPFSSPEDDPFYERPVPDQASLNLVDFLFPVPYSLEFLDPSPLTVAIDTEVVTPVKIILTNGIETKSLAQLTLISSDTDIVTVAMGGIVNDQITIAVRRLTAGAAFVTAEINTGAIPIQFQPPKVLKLIVNSVEDPLGTEID
jgi:hypothetical protein